MGNKLDMTDKYCIIHDQQGSVSVFFEYKHALFEFHKKKIQVALGSLTKEQLMEDLRHAIISCLGEGKTLGIMVDNLDPDFTSDITDEKVLPTQKIFNKALWTDKDKKEYLPFVKEHENFSPGRLNAGLFYPSEKFKIVIISKT